MSVSIEMLYDFVKAFEDEHTMPYFDGIMFMNTASSCHGEKFLDVETVGVDGKGDIIYSISDFEDFLESVKKYIVVTVKDGSVTDISTRKGKKGPRIAVKET